MHSRSALAVAFAISAFAASISALLAADDAAWSEPARYRFEYEVDLPTLTRDHAVGVRLWVPYPVETADQHVLSAHIDAPWRYEINRDGLGNRIVYLEGKGPSARPVTMKFEIEREPSHGIRAADVSAGTALDPKRNLGEYRLIPLGGPIRQVAEQESRGRKNDAEKVRAFYDYIVRTMRYNKDGTGWGRGDAVWACSNKRGNCTDFHSLFIGMARSEGIPARFLIGFPIPPDARAGTLESYHCWAQYYDRERGWVPVDASEANKTGLHDAYFGTLPNDRIEFTTGRDLVLVPPQHGPPLNYFIYPYAEVDGTPVEAHASFRFERLPVMHVKE
jgi:transglutaminase-like putative cysteine protease